MSNIGSNIGSKIKWCFILLKLVPSCPGTHAGVKFCVTCLFYFIWFFAQFPDLFIWLYPFSLIQSNPLKVWFDCFSLFFRSNLQIFQLVLWIFSFYISQTCKFVLFDFKPLQIAKVGFGVLDILVKSAFLVWNRRDLKICVWPIQPLISWSWLSRSNE